ncbi:MAG: helix-turn-helix domain-containing protein, partial [Longimicrobiales bacterium]
HVLRDEAEFEAAVTRVDELLDIDPPPGSAESDELEFLSVLIEAFEEEDEPGWGDASPQEIVEEMAQVHGVSRAELARLLGGRSRLSNFRKGVRELSKGQALALRERLYIPLDLLIR